MVNLINVSSRYKEAMSKKLRDRAYISIGIGIVNQNAQENATLNSSVSYWSKGNIFNTNQSNIEYATLEQNLFKTDGSMYFMPENKVMKLLNKRPKSIYICRNHQTILPKSCNSLYSPLY